MPSFSNSEIVQIVNGQGGKVPPGCWAITLMCAQNGGLMNVFFAGEGQNHNGDLAADRSIGVQRFASTLILKSQETVPKAEFEKLRADFTAEMDKLQDVVRENIQLMGKLEKEALLGVNYQLLKEEVRKDFQAEIDDLNEKLALADKKLTELERK